MKDDTTRDTVWWSDQGVNDNKAIGEAVWCDLKNLVTEQLSGKALYVVDAFCGQSRKPPRVRFFTEVAW